MDPRRFDLLADQVANLLQAPLPADGPSRGTDAPHRVRLWEFGCLWYALSAAEGPAAHQLQRQLEDAAVELISTQGPWPSARSMQPEHAKVSWFPSKLEELMDRAGMGPAPPPPELTVTIHLDRLPPDDTRRAREVSRLLRQAASAYPSDGAAIVLRDRSGNPVGNLTAPQGHLDHAD